ncbi:MAG: hypothetical protein HZB38_03660 [Planctomycetes bacterium]|nr:hypothetical protein [Planctomycetota bacterium]
MGARFLTAATVGALGFSPIPVIGQNCLLIPDSATDSIGLYSPVNGDYLGDLIVDSDPGSAGNLDVPINAIVGPDGLIYVSDQLKDSVLRYEQAGQFVDVFCGPDDGMDNLRGIAFYGSDLLVCYSSTTNPSDRGVARFSASGVRGPDLIHNGADPFDLLIFGNNLLLSDIAGARVSLYTTGGSLVSSVFSIDFPEQLQYDAQSGHFFNIAYNGNRITEFDLSGRVYSQLTITSLGRGVARLANGNLLITNSTSIREVLANTGATVRVVRSGTGFRFIERVQLGPTGCPVPGCEGGDLNGDCLVDLVDLTSFLSQFGQVGVPGTIIADRNNDGVVDLVDLTTLLSQFGLSCLP